MILDFKIPKTGLRCVDIRINGFELAQSIKLSIPVVFDIDEKSHPGAAGVANWHQIGAQNGSVFKSSRLPLKTKPKETQGELIWRPIHDPGGPKNDNFEPSKYIVHFLFDISLFPHVPRADGSTQGRQ